jgi:penicillin-binding protein 1A
LVAATWVGYGTPRNLGSRETGGGLSLPIWIDFMKVALNQEPVMEYPVPPGVIQVGSEWFFEEYGPSTSIRSLGLNNTNGVGQAVTDPNGNSVQANPEPVR